MGWTWYLASHYRPNGQIDRKKECDALLTEGFYAGFYRIEKSAMDGATYYAAVTAIKKGLQENPIPIPPEEQTTFAVIFLTSTDNRNLFNFGYKDMDETCGPWQDRCPKSILDLLSPTDNEFALDWRKRCRERLTSPSTTKRLHDLPIGTQIEFEIGGRTRVAKKLPPNHQFRTPYWSLGVGYYIAKKRIPDSFRVVAEA